MTQGPYGKGLRAPVAIVTIQLSRQHAKVVHAGVVSLRNAAAVALTEICENCCWGRAPRAVILTSQQRQVVVMDVGAAAPFRAAIRCAARGLDTVPDGLVDVGAVAVGLAGAGGDVITVQASVAQHASAGRDGQLPLADRPRIWQLRLGEAATRHQRDQGFVAAAPTRRVHVSLHM